MGMPRSFKINNEYKKHWIKSQPADKVTSGLKKLFQDNTWNNVAFKKLWSHQYKNYTAQ